MCINFVNGQPHIPFAFSFISVQLAGEYRTELETGRQPPAKAISSPFMSDVDLVAPTQSSGDVP